MLAKLFRLSTHPVVRWWWSMDRTMVVMILALMGVGAIAVGTASVAVSDTYDVDAYYFARRQVAFLLLALPVMMSFSFLSHTGLKRVSVLLFVVALAGVVLTLFMGQSVKGASRWVYVAGVSLQPTELLKPAFVILTAMLLSYRDEAQRRAGLILSGMALAVVGALILKQPDFSTFMVIGSVWFAQLFLAGVPFVILFFLASLGMVAVAGAYFIHPHIRDRLARFLDPTNHDSYQVDKATEALLSGGLFGRGPGEGVVKHYLPDAHTDFIFAVIGEEFGLGVCIIVLAMFAVIVLRGFSRILDRDDTFTLVAGSGLLLLFSFQVVVNIGVVLNVMPTTGMALPFISYGGSATLGAAILLGLMLSLIRRRGKSIDRRRR